jgi:hypothetical protein
MLAKILSQSFNFKKIPENNNHLAETLGGFLWGPDVRWSGCPDVLRDRLIILLRSVFGRRQKGVRCAHVNSRLSNKAEPIKSARKQDFRTSEPPDFRTH